MLSEEKAIIEVRKLRDVNKRNSLGKSIEIVLNLITKLQKENEEKDKQIDLMAKWIFDKDYKENSLLIHRDDYYSNCIKQVKQYFETKAKNN